MNLSNRQLVAIVALCVVVFFGALWGGAYLLYRNGGLAWWGSFPCIMTIVMGCAVSLIGGVAAVVALAERR